MASEMPMATMTMSSMPMASSSSTMHGMGTMKMGMEDMAMVFYTSTVTPLYGYAWAPDSTGSYAGLCIFLIFLSFVLRALYAYKTTLEVRWAHRALERQYIRVVDQDPAPVVSKRGTTATETAVLTSNGVDEKVQLIQRQSSQPGNPHRKPWRLSVDLPRALLVTVMLGLAYLLMLAVMTMNVGYFLSVLAGVFIGELFLGRYSAHIDEHH